MLTCPPPLWASWFFLRFIPVSLPSSARAGLVHVLQPTNPSFCGQSTFLAQICSSSLVVKGIGLAISQILFSSGSTASLPISREQMLKLSEIQFLDS